MNFKKIVSCILLSSISLASSQCMEKVDKTTTLTKDVFPGLEFGIPVGSYLTKRYNFCHYILRELYKNWFGYYPTKKTSNLGKFRSILINFLQSSVKFRIDEVSSFNSLVEILVNSYECLRENGDEFKSNVRELMSCWKKFSEDLLQSLA